MSIVLHHLVKRYGTQTVVDDVSLAVEEGELFVLLGASGSGKSTILRMIAGLAPVDDGRIVLNGRDVTDWPAQPRNIGMVFQHYALFPHMTVAENVEFGLAVRKTAAAERAARRDELLALIGLAGFAGRDVRQLSGGQQQRVAVARALAFSPAVLLLDEPFGALDVKIRGQLRRALKAIQRQVGVTTILVTHDQEEAFELADRIGVIEAGRLLEVGPPAQLYRRPRHEFVAGFLGEANLLGVAANGTELELGTLRLPIPPSARQDVVGENLVWRVLFRPEDLTLVTEDADPPPAFMGTAVVEEVLTLGPTQRVLLRLEPIRGAWPVGGDYGERGVPLRAVLPSPPDGEPALEAGQRVQVGVSAYHVLPRAEQRILFVADESPLLGSRAALAAALSAMTGGHLTVLCVAGDESAAQRVLAAAQDHLRSVGTQVGFTMRVGDTVEEALRATDGGEHHLAIFPGVTGDDLAVDGPPRMAAAFVRRSSISVLVHNGRREGLKRVLLCTGAGEPGKLDVTLAGRWTRAAGTVTTLLHVVESAARNQPAYRETRPPPRTVAWVERHLEQSVRVLQARGMSVETRVRQGPLLQEILAEVAEGDHDLVVVGAHIAGTHVRAPHRDLAAELIRRLDRPVLVVKGTADW